MKKSFFFLLINAFFLIFPVTKGLHAAELQISGGAEFAGGINKTNDEFGLHFRDNTGDHPVSFNANYTTMFFAPGMSLEIRLFPDLKETFFERGFVFRGRAVFISNYRQTGTLTTTSSLFSRTTDDFSSSYSAIDDDFFISSMDFDIGHSSRFNISYRFEFYVDLGANLTIMDFEELTDERKEVTSYWGCGIFAQLGFQVSLAEPMYLEFGLCTIVNVFSSREKKRSMPEYSQRVEYTSGDRWDLTSLSLYVHLGWRIDIYDLRNSLKLH